MSFIVGEIKKIYPNLSGVTIAINSASAPARTLAVTLFDLGATIVVGDRNPDLVNALNKVLYERSGSALRYFPTGFQHVNTRQSDVFVELEEPIGVVNAKHVVRPARNVSKSGGLVAGKASQ